jgi:hypothetical protein
MTFAVDLSLWRMRITDPEVHRNTYLRSLLATPGLIWRSFAPEALGGDTSAIGDIQRDFFLTNPVNRARMGLHNLREQNPILANTIDALRSTTPAGLGMTLAARAAASGEVESNYLKDIGRLVAANKEKLLTDPDKSLRSPILKTYVDLLTSEPVLNEMERHKGHDDRSWSWWLRGGGWPAHEEFIRQTQSQQAQPLVQRILQQGLRVPGSGVYSSLSGGPPLIWSPQALANDYAATHPQQVTTTDEGIAHALRGVRRLVLGK